MATPSLTAGESPPVTLGELLAHSSRCNIWTGAIFVCLTLTLAFTYYAKSQIAPAPLSSVPWLLALLISWGAYLSLLFMVRDYAYLFLPRTPVAVVVDKIHKIGMCGAGGFVIGGMVTVVLVFGVRDSRVLASCNAVAHAFIVCLVGFCVWLARTYGGDGDALDGI